MRGVAVLGCCALFGCVGPSDVESTSGLPEAATAAVAPVVVFAHPGAVERVPVACRRACLSSEACVRGECIATCGVDAEALDQALAPSFKLLGAFCGDHALYSVPRDTIFALDVTRSQDTYTFDLRMPVEYRDPFATRAVDAAPGIALAPRFLAMNPQARAVFGYTSDEPGAPGAIFAWSGNISDPPIRKIDAPGNRGGFFISQTEVLVSANSLGTAHDGPGVYRADYTATELAPTRVLSLAGTQPGSVVLLGGFEPLMLVGATDATGEATFAMVSDAANPVTALSDPRVSRLDLPARFVKVGDDQIATVKPTGIEARRVTRTGSTVTAGAPERWTTGSAFNAIERGGYSTLVFVHAHGIWVTNDVP